MMVKYFGVNIKQKPDGLKLTRDNYIKISNKSSFRNGEVYSDEYIQRQNENGLYNYDLNMNYFRLLPKEEFNKELINFINKNESFKEISNLAPLSNISGYYMMVLDEYSQVYIGQTSQIKERIQSHWSKQKEFDRLIFGGKEKSILSIDSFRAYDTTRIFVAPTNESLELEEGFIDSFNEKYILNRTKGGALSGLIEAIINRKTRELR
ncbi:hypothetical protein FA002_02075 [Priestia megaterium]|uniref:GIY-YIG nuclease family protein n=1 Tax=Priestia megaterium TaxID=1404 RepID=UPI0010AB5254|nr:GIY-YIG nuclease family protein [Priestia megaterium]TJZ40380.1 hypothetical protein FA002_02075 [Priestia megaterium]